MTAQEITRILKQSYKQNVFSNHEQQYLHHSICIPKPIHFQEVEQYRSSTNHKEKKKRLVETVSQDAKGIGNNDRHTKIGEEYQETGRKS